MDAEAFYSLARRKQIRAIYYAMISEFDAMVRSHHCPALLACIDACDMHCGMKGMIPLQPPA